MVEYTKETLVAALNDICDSGWVKSCREPGNHGAVGNTLEQLLGIDENNLPLPDAGDWELKGQRRILPAKNARKAPLAHASSLLTLFHMEPSPREYRFVPGIFLPKYGWPLTKNANELSFRLTIGASDTGGRGFRVVVDDTQRKVLISFNASLVNPKNYAWLKTVEERVGLGEVSPQPYWEFDELEDKLVKKLKNIIHVMADSKVQDNTEYFKYNGISILEKFSMENFIELMRQDLIKIDFDARSGHGRIGHNHGTKFRMKSYLLPTLYATVTKIIDAPLSYLERSEYINLTNIFSTTRVIKKSAREDLSILQMTFLDEEE